MPLLTLFMEFVVFHTLMERLLYEPKYEATKEDEEILPIYDSANAYRPLSMERIFMIQHMLR